MPSYNYKCTVCGIFKEFILPMNHEPPNCSSIDCPKDKQLVRKYSSPGLIFKGSGWTETTSQTREKNKKLQKLYKDSAMKD